MVYASRRLRGSQLASASPSAGRSQATRCASWSSHSTYRQSCKPARPPPTRPPASRDLGDPRKRMIAVMPLRAGTLLQGRYLIGRPIGHGGMGAVYEVTDQRLDARAALKQILRSTPVLREAFEREARLLRNLKHRSLPKAFDYFIQADADFLVMDFIEGPDVAELIIQQGALPIDQVLAWADHLLDGLIYLHTRQPPVVHRDIKPQNIKIGTDDIPVLLDFGIAKDQAGNRPSTSSNHSVAAYSRPYAPIEQLLGMPTTPQSDLFSLGATLYHMLAAQLPVAAGQRQDAVNNGRPDPLQPIHQINGRVPAVLSNLLQHLLALRASDRPASAADVRQELQAARSRSSP